MSPMASQSQTASVPVTDEMDVSLVGLLGEQRAAIVEHLHREGPQPVAALATHLAVSEVATRRHLAVLVGDGLVEEQEQRSSGGRPAACFGLTDRAARLFPQRYDRFANEVLDYLTATQGRDGLLAFLRWRVDREADALAAQVTDGPLAGRLVQLADALSTAGFASHVETEASAPDALRLVQRHCAIEDVAREHPEICAYEAAAFARALGPDVQLSRGETIANGDANCVCRVTPRPGLHPPNAPPGSELPIHHSNPDRLQQQGARA
jgi:predicted ArsR family transcriptional regulator